MLNQLDIDILQQQIQNKQIPELYYVAHNIETREGLIDESQYKSVPRFKIIKVKISKIFNAYKEYLNFVNNPDNYHVEQEEEFYNMDTSYIHYYTVPNSGTTKKYFNARMPSIIYGYRRVVKEGDQVITDYSDASPVKPVFVNALEYGELKGDDIQAQYDAGNLDWKYITLENKEIVDGIEYKYVTSDWYILECENFPRTEHILINTKSKCAYFRDLKEAFDFVEQCEA